MKRIVSWYLIGALSILKGYCSPVLTKDRTMFGSTAIGEYPQTNQGFLKDPGWWKGPPDSSAGFRRPAREPLGNTDVDDLSNTVNPQVSNSSTTIDSSKVLNDIISRLPNPPRDLPLSNLTMLQITASVDYVSDILLQEFVASECKKIVMAEFFLNALKKHIQMEFWPSRSGSLYTKIKEWSMTTMDAGQLEKPLDKNSINAIVAIVYGPVTKRIDQLRKDFEDILGSVEEFFDIPRPELSSPLAASMSLRDALQVLFGPFGTVTLSSSADCATSDVITDLLHMCNDISTYFQNYIVNNFVVLLSSNKPRLSYTAAKSLLEYLKENYGMPGPILHIASLSMAPSDTNELRWQCARAMAELYFGGVLLDDLPINQEENISSLELAELLEQYNSPFALAGDKPKPSHVATLVAQHRSVLNKRGVTDISPMQILTTFCQILLDESESNGLNRTKLSMAISQSLDRMGQEGIQTGSSDRVDSAAVGYTVDVLSGLMDIMKQIINDILEVLPKQGQEMTAGNNVTSNGTANYGIPPDV